MEVARRQRYGPIDFFGLWDIIAYRDNKVDIIDQTTGKVSGWMKTPEFLLVQVKSNYCPPDIRQKLKEFSVPKGVKRQLVIYKDYSRNPWVEDLL